MKTYKFTDEYGDTMDAYLIRGKYYNGSLSVEMVAKYDGVWEPWATLTVNLGVGGEGHAFIDTNNCPWATAFLEENGLAIPMGVGGQSGYCTYPLYAFTEKFFDTSEEYGEE